MCTNKHYYCMFNDVTVITSDVIDKNIKNISALDLKEQIHKMVLILRR